MERPFFATIQEYAARFTDPVFWQPYVTAICARHWLSCDTIRAGLPGTNAVFLVDERYAVKIYPELFHGAEGRLIERDFYTLIANAQNIPAPAIIASGELFDAAGGWPWPYIVTNVIPGTSLGEAHVTPADREALAAWLGALVRRIHSLQLDDTVFLQPTWERFKGFLAERRANVKASHTAWQSLPPHLIAQLDGYLPAREHLVDESVPPCVIHCDLNRDHVLGEARNRQWQPNGIIDFGDGKVGDRLYELVALHIGLFDCDKHLLKVFLEHYGFDEALRRDFVQRAMAMTLLHEFNVLHGMFENNQSAAGVGSLEELAQVIWALP